MNRRDLPPLVSYPDPIEPDDFEAEIAADEARERAAADFAAGHGDAYRELMLIIDAPSDVAQHAAALNDLRASTHQFLAPETATPQIELPSGFVPFPAIRTGLTANPFGAPQSGESSANARRGPTLQERLDVESRNERRLADEQLADDELDEEDGRAGEDEPLDDSREDEEALAELREQREAAEREKLRLLATNAPIPPIPQSAYVSPFTTAAADTLLDDPQAVELAFKLESVARADYALHAFLTDIAHNLPLRLLPDIRAAHKGAVKRFGALPDFRSDALNTTLALIDPEKITSFCPCVVLGQSIRSDNIRIAHMEALLGYMFVAEGRVREMFQNVARRNNPSSIIVYSDLVGTDPASRPLPTSGIDKPGIYGVNPMGRFVILGMTHALGLDRRGDLYERTEYAPSGKMGILQAYMAEQGTAWPGERFGVMWHGVTVPISSIPVPASAIYAAETMLIVMTGSSNMDATVMKNLLISRPPVAAFESRPDQVNLPVYGLNTNYFDTRGAFQHQSALSIAGARELVRKLISVNAELKPLPVYRTDKPNDPTSQAAAAKYRAMFRGIVPDTIAMSTVYKYVKLRTMVVRRAVYDLRAELDGFAWELLPGKNALQWISDRWLRKRRHFIVQQS